MKRLLFLMLTAGLLAPAAAQYAPQAGIAGSTAIPAASPQIYAWATGCRITRGLQQIGNPGGGYVTAGDSSVALGPSDGSIVSLGDSGVAVLTFAQPVSNGPGPDFAVFENGFTNPVNGEEAFLELAFAEVSSDGISFFRFPAASLTPDTVQVPGAGVYLNARQLHNLAGKYSGGFGTPFDLQELAGTPGLDINHITHIRLVDVIGSVGAHASLDASGRKINDPFPTPFPGGGFDLDAVAVLRPATTGAGMVAADHRIGLFPNPASDRVSVRLNGTAAVDGLLHVTDMSGRTVLQEAFRGNGMNVDVSALSPGVYYLFVNDKNGNQWAEKMYRQ